MNIKELYQEIILEHGKNPRNLRKTDNFNKDGEVSVESIAKKITSKTKMIAVTHLSNVTGAILPINFTELFFLNISFP